MVLGALDILYPGKNRFKNGIDNHIIILFKSVPKWFIDVFLLKSKKNADKRVQLVDAKNWLKTFTSLN